MRAYEYVDHAAPEGIILEIGLMRENQSTGFLRDWCARQGRQHVAVDIDPDICEQARAKGVKEVYCEAGESYLTKERGRVAFAYLDGFDWPYPSVGPDKLQEQTERYEALGLELTAHNSAMSHLVQSMLLFHLLVPGAVVAFDDTFVHGGLTGGKGGYAVPYLLAMGMTYLRAPDDNGGKHGSCAVLVR